MNRITVAAADDLGHSATRELSITQVSLDSIVVAQVTTERLSPEEIEQLVADGVIELDDPENYNVSVFTIVITVEGEPVRIEVPVAIPIAEEDAGGEANLPMPDADNAGGVPRPAPQEIVIFEDLVPSPAPGQPPVSIPGVLVIEGRIKSLKEFFAVRLLLMNTSGIFTLSDVTARIEFPDGGLSSVMPQSGTVGFGDILPGDGATPGQAEREFIVRGDEIGVRPLRVAFGGHLTGPGIPDDEPIPFNGDANASLEVKGPPTFLVQVHHPPRVSAGEVYDLKIDITNTGETPALYASLDLDTGADAEIVECTTDDETGEPDCAEIDGPVTRALGHVLVGQSVSQTFTLRSTVSGRIGSCLAVADQNIQLQVLVGNSGCLVGQFPPEEGAPAGIPTATVLPLANMMGVSTQSPVTAFFSELMDEVTITTGEGGSFQVFANGTSLVPGTLRFDEIFGRTVAIWQVNDGATNRLRGNTEYAVRLTQAIEDREGNPLFGEWVSTFTTTGDLLDDVTAPELTLTVLPPVDPNRILPGQLVRVDAYAADQGSGVARVEARLKDVDVEGALYELIDQKTVFEGDEPPYVFAIDSATLVPGHAYQLLVTAYDAMANGRDATVSLVMAQSASAPVIRLPDDPAEPVLHGISLDVTPVEVGEAVREVRFYLDGAADPFKTVTLAPFQASVGTIDLGLGPHSVRAVAVDGLDQSGSDRLEFELADNPNMPVVDFAGAVDGTRYVAGTNITIDGDASDPVGIRSVLYFLDQPSGTPIASGTQPFLLGTADLSLGAHRVYAVATNLLGVSNDVADPASSLEFQVVAPPTGNPPPAPLLASVSPPSDAGIVTVGGSSVPGAHVELTNLARGLTTAVDAAADGSFGATIPGAAGETLSAVAYDYAASLDPSPASTAVIPAAPVLERIEVAPAALHFTAAGEFADLVVTGHYDSGATENLTSRASYGTSDAGVATVGGSGRVVAHASGEATITARFGDQESPCAVSVAIVTLSFITVEPPEIV
ncbi:MAG: Ig-like domain-containing protein, partial [Acidobacteria bacterium]|nr:Ig-like domain-containing protein [Acidobacteriota bacterium]